MRGGWLETTPRQRFVSNAVLAIAVAVAAAALLYDGIDGMTDVFGLAVAPLAFATCVIRAVRGWRELRDR